ncbi:MAG: hypothetical protein Q9191_005941 [Dirinaria sp. TL-2023a]
MMTTSPPVQRPELLDTSQKQFPSSPPTYNANPDHGTMGDADGRSSSLSDIEDGGIIADSPSAQAGQALDAGDTEAETERLEESPHKDRKHQNIVLTESLGDRGDGGSVFKHLAVSTEEPSHDKVDGNTALQTSDISSLEDSSENSSTSYPRKRKRSARIMSAQRSREQSETIPDPLASPSGSTKGKALGEVIADEDMEDGDEAALSELDDEQNLHRENSVESGQEHSNDERKAKMVKSNHEQSPERPDTEIGIVVEPAETVGEVDSNGEDGEMEEGVDDAEVDMGVRNEESLAKKKSAQDTLGAIESCFASLREKLYDERIARCDAELAMLEAAIPTHPELLTALEVIDRHRDEKIHYEDTLVKFKLQALQRKSIAEKAQAHSQYMLDVQQTRENHLEKLNKEIYQIQRERRSTETTGASYMYHFPTKRSEQIRRQTAYNKEVSILSGVAKHVGFPAAPDLKQLKQHEIDEDLKAMGVGSPMSSSISLQPPQPQPTISRPTLTASSSLSRQKSAADERFLEQNPWANPQHPVHSHLQRQRSALSRPESPLVTPAPQKRVIDLTGTQGSASTIPETQSGPNSSMAPTPLAGEQAVQPSTSHNGGGIHSTPIKQPEVPNDNDIPISNARDHTIGSLKHHSAHQQGHIATHSKKPHVYGVGPSHSLVAEQSSPAFFPKKNTPSSPPRFPTVKAEEPTHGMRQSPLSHSYRTPTPVSAEAHGQVHRFGAT